MKEQSFHPILPHMSVWIEVSCPKLEKLAIRVINMPVRACGGN